MGYAIKILVACVGAYCILLNFVPEKPKAAPAPVAAAAVTPAAIIPVRTDTAPAAPSGLSPFESKARMKASGQVYSMLATQVRYSGCKNPGGLISLTEQECRDIVHDVFMITIQLIMKHSTAEMQTLDNSPAGKKLARELVLVTKVLGLTDADIQTIIREVIVSLVKDGTYTEEAMQAKFNS